MKKERYVIKFFKKFVTTAIEVIFILLLFILLFLGTTAIIGSLITQKDFDIMIKIAEVSITMASVMIGFGFLLYSKFFDKLNVLGNPELELIELALDIIYNFIFVVICGFSLMLFSYLPDDFSFFVDKISLVGFTFIILLFGIAISFKSVYNLISYPTKKYPEFFKRKAYESMKKKKR